jgi:hypothetical protein
VKAELAQGRRCQVFAVYTQKRDVTQGAEGDPKSRRHTRRGVNHGHSSGSPRGLV